MRNYRTFEQLLVNIRTTWYIQYLFKTERYSLPKHQINNNLINFRARLFFDN